MKHTRPAWIALLLATASAIGHAAPPIYRCGSSYSQFPCNDGQAIQADDSRDAAQKRQADAATRRDADLAEKLEKDRLARERAALASAPTPPRTAAKSGKSAKTRQAPQPAASDAAGAPTVLKPVRVKPQLERPKDFVAEVPGTRKNPRRKQDSQAD